MNKRLAPASALPDKRLAPALLLLGCLLAAAPAGAAEREYSFGAGVGTLLSPLDTIGASLAFSAAVSPSWGGRRLIRLRGELQGFVTDGAWAVLPTISADAGLRLGRLDLYLTGGVELFGGARRNGYTLFANLGLLGGGGLAVRVSSRVRVGLRALLVWLPSFAAIKLSAPEGMEQPTYLGLSGMISVDIIGGRVTDDFDFDEF